MGGVKGRVYQTIEWNDEQIQVVRTGWDLGWSGGVIARHIGPSCTPNMVIGKVHRLKLTPRPARGHGTITAEQKELMEANRTPARTTQREKLERAPKAPAEKPPQVLKKIILQEALRLDGALIGIESLDPARMCCWPIGDPHAKDFHYCGNSPLTRKPYCAAHMELARPVHAAPAVEKPQRQKLRLGQMSLWR